MENYSKRELLEIIHKQEETLRKYKVRLRDTVVAYKALAQEKDAIEASLKALSSLSTATGKSENIVDPLCQTGSDPAFAFQDPLLVNPGIVARNGDENLRKQLSTLTASLATLTDTKSRMETEFLADKKRLLQEKDELASELEEARRRSQAQSSSLGSQIAELKERLRDHQRDREKEQQDYGVMLRELQHVLADERARKERLECKLQEVKDATQRREMMDKSLEYEQRIQCLSNEIQGLHDRLKASENKANTPSPLLLDLQLEMEKMKVQHYAAVEHEKQRANKAEEKLKMFSTGSEERVANLEVRLSELSEMVGSYDNLRQQDQLSILKLKERVAQLDSENEVLMQAIKGDMSPEIYLCDDSNLDVHTLVEKITKLKSLIHVANERSENPLDLNTLFQMEKDDASQHARCQEELQQLKDEFERYKMRAQSVLKCKNTKDSDLGREVEVFRIQVSDLQEKLQNMKAQLDSTTEHHISVESKLQSTILELKIKHRQEISTLETQHKAKLVEMEQQMQRQRERTLALLDEKEKEIQLLRTGALLTIAAGCKRPSIDEDSVTDNSDSSQQSAKVASGDIDIFADMAGSFPLGTRDSKLFHYMQEMARKDMEISNLRRARHQAESALRELQHAVLLKEEKNVEEIECLRAKIHRLESVQSQEGTSMEYLKNVVLRYMLCRDANGRHHMANAISAVLHFTPRELELVRQFNQRWWWTGSSST